MKPIIREALPKFALWADEGISATNRRHVQCEIWTGDRTGLDEQEYDALTDIMIERATLNAAVAQAVRGLVSLYQEAQILIILGPRFWATWQLYRGNGGFVLPL